jgi:hypothetical protein
MVCGIEVVLKCKKKEPIEVEKKDEKLHARTLESKGTDTDRLTYSATRKESKKRYLWRRRMQRA